MIPKLKTLYTIEEINDFVEEVFRGKKGLQGTKEKIYRGMEYLFTERIMSINTRSIEKLELRYRGRRIGEYSPIIAFMSAGVIPCLRNFDLYRKDYYPQYMKYVIQTVYEALLSEKVPYKERTWMIVDEIGQIYKRGKKRTVAAEALIDSITEGRKPDIACAYSLQSYSKVDDEVKLNTTHALIFNTSEAKDLADFRVAFSLDKETIKEIATLGTFQCIAVTKHSFIVYDVDGKRYKTKGPIKGRCLFPLSEHVKPGKKDSIITEEEELDDDEEEIIESGND